MSHLNEWVRMNVPCPLYDVCSCTPYSNAYVPIIFITAQSIVRIGKEPEPVKKERVGLWATFKLNMQIFSAAAVAAASTWVRVIYYHGSWVDFSSSGRAASSGI